MNNKPIILFGLLLLISLSGCGVHHTNITYCNPTWHPNGRILAAKSIYEYDTTMDYPGTVRNDQSSVYLTEIVINNANNNYVSERDLFRLESSSYEIKLSASPDGNYIMYHAFDGVGNPSIIHIVSYPNGEKTNDIYWNENINSFDWGPDSDRIVFATEDTKKMYIMKKDGTGTFEVTGSAESVAWRVGDKIAIEKYRGSDYARIGVINIDGSSEEVTSLFGGDVQKTEDKIYYRGREDLNIELINAIREASIDGNNDILKINNYQRHSLMLSFDNTKIVGGKWTQNGIEGIWVMDLTGNNEKQIK